MSRPRPHKRPRTESPTGWMECDDLTAVPNPHLLGKEKGDGLLLRTPIASTVSKEVFLDRLRKEIVEPFQFSLNSQLQIRPGESVLEAKERRKLIKSRILVGISVCSKALSAKNDSSAPTFLDLLVVSSDYQPAHFAAHLPLLAHQRQVPLLLLPEASNELGTLLGIRRAGVVAFTRPPADTSGEEGVQDIHDAVTSFVAFIKNRIEMN